MTQIYLNAASKKAANVALNDGLTLVGEHHGMHGMNYIESRDWNTGDVIKVFSKRVGGIPYAKSYGTVIRKGLTVKIK
jgi:hypothetical protein